MPTLLATGFSFKIKPEDPSNSARIGVVAFFLILYTLFYSPGAGVVPFLYSSEIWPLAHREVGMSWAVFWNFLLAGLLALTVPQLHQTLGHTRLLGLFAGLDTVAFIAVWLLMPGTVEVTTLEETNYIFAVPTKRHVQYQAKTVLPWFLRTLRHPSSQQEKLAPLYQWHRRQELMTSGSDEAITSVIEDAELCAGESAAFAPKAG